jgi:hypothetical protein
VELDVITIADQGLWILIGKVRHRCAWIVRDGICKVESLLDIASRQCGTAAAHAEASTDGAIELPSSADVTCDLHRTQVT